MPWAPQVTVATIVEQDGRFLMVEEHTDEGIRINQPAGHLEPGESLLDAAVRETLEETAERVTLNHLVGVYQWTQPASGRTYVRFAFAASRICTEAGRTLDVGIIRALWVSPDELRALSPCHRSPLVLRCLDDYLAGHRFALGVVHHQGAAISVPGREDRS